MQPSAPQVFDPEKRRRVRARGQWHRAKNGHAPDGDLMARLVEDLEDRLATVQRTFSEIVIIGGPNRMLETCLNRRYPDAHLRHADLDHADNLKLDPESADLVVSLQVFHTINDLPGVLIQCRRALKPDGLMIGSLCGAGTLAELRDVLLETDSAWFGGAMARVAPFADVRDMGGLLQRAGFALPVTDTETLTLRYDHLFALIADLRAEGCGSALASAPSRPTTKAYWQDAAMAYADRHADPDGRIRMTLSLIWLSGWAPAESQPKPLKPGSGKVSLASILRPAEEDGGSD